MKVYKDIDEVIKPTEVPKKLWEYEKEMKKKPNFDKVKINLKNINKKEGKPRIKQNYILESEVTYMSNKTQPIGKNDTIKVIKEGTTVEFTSKPAPPSTPKQPTGK